MTDGDISIRLNIDGAPTPEPDTPYFTTEEFRARYPDLNDTRYPDALIDEYRQLAEQSFEDACDRAFVPRTATDTLTQQPVTTHTYAYGYYNDYSQSAIAPSCAPRRLAHPDVRRIVSATDQTNTTLDLTNVQVSYGWVYGLTATGPVTVTYEYGLDQPPLRVKHAVMALAREWMVSGPVTDRQTGIPTEGGGSISLALPGGRFGTFGLPEVDAAVEQYGSSQVFVA